MSKHPGHDGRATVDEDLAHVNAEVMKSLLYALDQNGMSERLLCEFAGMNRKTWRAVRKRQRVVSLTEFVSLCKVLQLHPPSILNEAMR